MKKIVKESQNISYFRDFSGSIRGYCAEIFLQVDKVNSQLQGQKLEKPEGCTSKVLFEQKWTLKAQLTTKQESKYLLLNAWQ